MYYDILKKRINAGGEKLGEIQEIIKRFYANGDLTVGQMEELIELSQQKADHNAERPEYLSMLQSLAVRVEALEKKLASAPGEDGNEAEGETETEAWHPWDGISNKYQKDAIVSHNGKLWQSVFEGQNVWEPGAVGTESLWVEYEEV